MKNVERNWRFLKKNVLDGQTAKIKKEDKKIILGK